LTAASKSRSRLVAALDRGFERLLAVLGAGEEARAVAVRGFGDRAA
jgi:hypothetical protein